MSEPKISTSAVDRISSLPDDILISILSSLSTKQAFVTSILSKRWTRLFYLVPNLDFSYIKQEVLEAFVDYILRSRKSSGNHPINSFILMDGHYSDRLCDIVVGNWATVTPDLPTSILACTTLVVLKLGWFNMGADFYLNSIRLPSLKTLHLKYIRFKQDVDLVMILDKCPILEDLQLSNIFSNCSSTYYCKSSENLKKLNRADITTCYCDFPLKALSNLKYLRLQLLKVCLSHY